MEAYLVGSFDPEHLESSRLLTRSPNAETNLLTDTLSQNFTASQEHPGCSKLQRSEHLTTNKLVNIAQQCQR